MGRETPNTLPAAPNPAQPKPPTEGKIIMFGSALPPFPNILAFNLCLAFVLLIVIIRIAVLVWPDPEDAREIKKMLMLVGHVNTIEKERIDKETRLENLKIRDWNPFIEKEHIIKNPTYDDVLRRRHVTFKTKSPVQKWGRRTYSTLLL